jgi:3-oxoacyl-[acyl-carrier-protein] synthase-3
LSRYAYVTGWGKYIPKVVLTNDDLAEIVDTSDAWIVEHTGIKERHVATGEETVAYMSARAARDALAMAGRSPDDLDLIIVSTSSPDRQLPGASFIVQAMLGAARAAAFDLRSGCSGFIASLAVARQFIGSGTYHCVLVVGAEVVLKNVNWKDRRTCVLFGDGAGAVVLEGGDAPGGILFTAMGAQGKDYQALTVKAGGSEYSMCPVTTERGYHTIELDGRKTADFAVRTLLRRPAEAVSRAGLTLDDIELFIPHQANLRLIELASERLGIPMERIFVNVDRYANMSTASIAVALTEAAEGGRLKAGDHVLLTGFGAGLAWATAVIRWGTPAEAQGLPTATGWLGRLRQAWLRLCARSKRASLDLSLWSYELRTRLKRWRQGRSKRS